MRRDETMDIRPIFVRLGFVAVCTVLCFDAAAAGVNRWTSLGPPGGYVQDLAVDSSDPGRIFAATQTGLFRTIDAGMHWLPTSVGSAATVAISASDPNVVYTGSFRSEDGGSTWTPMASAAWADRGVQRIAVDPAEPRVIHAGFVRIEQFGLRQYHAGVATSRDGGKTWRDGFEVGGTDFFGASAVAVITDALRPTAVYAAVYSDIVGSAVYVSNDRGATWQPGGAAAARFSSLALGSGTVLSAGTLESGVLTSTDGGATWHPAFHGPDAAATRVASDPRDRSTLYASTDHGLFRTRGTASAWTLVDPDLLLSYLLVDPTSSQTLYSWGTTDGVLRSENSGADWSPRNAGLNALYATAVAVDPSNATNIYAGDQGRVWRTLDGGAAWSAVDLGSPFAFVSALLVDPHIPSIVYAAAGRHGLFRSENAGGTWAAVERVPAPDVYVGAIVASSTSGVLYAGILDGGVWKSTDFGVSWSSTGSGLGQVFAIAVDPVAPSRVWAGTGGGLYRSEDSGLSWTLEAFPDQTVYAVTVAGSTVWAAPYPELWHRSGNDDWIRAEIPPIGYVSGILVDAGDPSLVVLLASARLYQTRNGGLGFVVVQNGLGDVPVAGIVADPGGHRMYAATRGRGIASYDRSNLITLPAVASLHGAPPTYFHSDVDVVNTSATRSATVTARYRCFVGACGAPSEATVTIPPRGLHRVDDIVGTLFAAPESGGAVELDSSEPILVTSRLYSPEKPSPTLGMFVSGQYPEDSHPRSILTSLAHSSGAAGSRTNIGVFNPDDAAQTIRFSLVGLDGSPLGALERTIPAGEGLQINDPELAATGLPDDSTFVAFVEGDPRRSVYAYAAVIDNQSQDPIFVPGRDAEALDGTRTFPAAASLHGAGGTFFHSDVVITNMQTFPVSAVLDYRCSLGPCPPLENKLIVLGIGESVAIDDVVGTTFAAPETGGTVVVEANGPIVATSRLYTPSHPQPTVGMFVPGQRPADAAPRAVLGSLSSSRDLSRGSRVNVGAFNGSLGARNVTFRLFDESGGELGSVEQVFGGLQSIQLNDIFTLAGVTADVPAAYCLVEADGFGPFYPYAAVIDNQSQDPIFVPGQNDPNPPPHP